MAKKTLKTPKQTFAVPSPTKHLANTQARRRWVHAFDNLAKLEPNKWVSVPELASLLGLNPIAVYLRLYRGGLTATRFGGLYAIPTNSLIALLTPTIQTPRKRKS